MWLTDEEGRSRARRSTLKHRRSALVISMEPFTRVSRNLFTVERVIRETSITHISEVSSRGYAYQKHKMMMSNKCGRSESMITIRVERYSDHGSAFPLASVSITITPRFYYYSRPLPGTSSTGGFLLQFVVMAEVKGFDLLLLLSTPPPSFLAKPISIDLVFQIVANPFRENSINIG